MGKPVILLLMIAIFISLAVGAFFLLKEPASSTRTIRALSARIVMSICLFSLLFWGWFAGWMHPHGLGQL